MRRPSRCGLTVLLSYAIAAPLQAWSDIWTEPVPTRREALIGGRDFDYNSEAFLQRFSYRHLDTSPHSSEDGVRGTAGSVTGDELFVDISLQKHLHFDDDLHSVFVRMQRFEDFDNRFDRQVVGVTRRLGDNWRVALAGDLAGEKSEIDVQLEAYWQPDAVKLFRLIYIRPDYFFNDKGGDGKYTKEPQTLFLNYRHFESEGLQAEVAINYSPEATFSDRRHDVRASGEQVRVMLAVSAPVGPVRLGVRGEHERTERYFVWREIPAPNSSAFDRRMHCITAYFTMSRTSWSPEVGLNHFSLRESGWFGTEAADSGVIRRSENTVYAGISANTGERQRWQPTVYIRQVERQRHLSRNTHRNRDEKEWIGKLALPWRYTVNQSSGAVLTINPTLRLHRAAFGGGNIQLHWPL